MFTNIKKTISITAISLLVASGLLLAAAPIVDAAVPPPGSERTGESEAAKQVCQGLSQADGSVGCNATANGTKISTLLNTIINLFSWVVGFLSVIMIIYGGFRYVTSAGDSAKLTAARQTILYALIGLVIVALSQIIVKFVVGQFVR